MVVAPGVVPTFRAIDPAGNRWWVEVAGGRTGTRPGLQRIEVLWKAVAKGAVVQSARPGEPFVVLSWGLPSAASGGRALDLVTGADRPLAAVIDLSDDDAVARLRSLLGEL